MRYKGNVRWWVVVALFVLAFLWFVPQLQGRYFSKDVPSKEVPALVNEYRKTWAQILGGAALLSGLYFTWRTLQVNREGQITERFTRAIDQLGSDKLEVRLGGIYALERIARDSPERDYSTVIEVLTAYVRENAKASPMRKDGTPSSVKVGPPKPEADIQAILDVLKRLTQDRRPEILRIRRNLSKTNLQGADLSGANLGGVDLTEADLREAKFGEADLEGADLEGADLRAVDLTQIKGTPQHLAKAHGDKNTQLPSGFKRPAHWLKTDE